jgi:hypothetical protein
MGGYRQKSRNGLALSSESLWPSQSCNRLVSWPASASRCPAVCLSMCGWQCGNPARASIILATLLRVIGPPRSEQNTKADCGCCSRRNSRKARNSIALDRVHGVDAVLETPDVQMTFGEIDLIPLKIDGLGHPQAVPSHEQDQCGPARNANARTASPRQEL